MHAGDNILPCVVTVAVAVVCVSFSHYVDGMIPIVSDRSSHCKHHVCKKQRENRKCIWQRERSVWEKKSRNKCIEEKREQCVCARVCVYKEWRVLIEKISAPASVSWLQTSTVAPCRNYTPLLPHLGHSAAPPNLFIYRTGVGLLMRCKCVIPVQWLIEKT